MTSPIDADLLWERVRLARAGAAVERCHVYPHLMRYSVGHHTADLITLLILCWAEDHDNRRPPSALLVAAAFHDTAEAVIGDIPSPIKDLLGSYRLDVVEDNVLAYLGCKHYLNEEEQEYLNAADRFELYLWAREEIRRGNSLFQTFFDEKDPFWKDMPPAFRALGQHLFNEKSGKIERLPWTRLKEIAKL